MPPELLVTVGLPGCGKSTWASGSGFPVVTLDVYRDLGPHRFLMTNARRSVAAHFADGAQRVVVDGCNLQPSTRSMWLGLAASLGCRPVAVVFTTDPVVCRQRDLARGDQAIPSGKFNMFEADYQMSLAAVPSEPWAEMRHVNGSPISRQW